MVKGGGSWTRGKKITVNGAIPDSGHAAARHADAGWPVVARQE
jgi:hypothetical protein